jgi:hypothetical protein
VDRRNFCKLVGASAASMFLPNNILSMRNENNKIKPINGSWFEFQHHSGVEGKYWNDTLWNFSDEQWRQKVREIASTGMEYLVLMNVAIYDKTFYPTNLLPRHDLKSQDPLEIVLDEADKVGLKFFVSNGFWGNWVKPDVLMQDKEIEKLRIKGMVEVAERYSHHKSFYGWYYPNETGIVKHYDDFFIKYVNTSTEQALKLTPNAKTLIAPYGTRQVANDDKYVKQLEQLNVDFIAYQDEIGVEKTKIEESAKIFENLYYLHQKAGKAKLWADVEVFRFEGKVYNSALLPAPAHEVEKQLEAVSPYVENILIYQYTGMINKPNTDIIAGHPDSTKLYEGIKKYFPVNYR